jgi:uncharacterized RDD family membrane protein YckC
VTAAPSKAGTPPRRRGLARPIELGPVGPRLVHEVVTPEGVPIRFAVSTVGDRFVALLIDVFLILVLELGAGFAIAYLGDAAGFGSEAMAVVVVMAFLILHGYFAWFEAGPRGATPGKRRLGLRVVDRRGGALSTEAVIVRNLTRHVELWLPMAALAMPQALWPGAPGWLRLVALLWLLGFAFLPCFNALHLRIGDLVAGTLVVEAPKATLLADLGRAPASRAGAAAAALAPSHEFTDEQLDVYGIYELQVLEDVLRGSEDPAQARAARDAAAKTIRAKIGWPPAAAGERSEAFLRDFYAALRGRLERRMLLGKRKADKWSK